MASAGDRSTATATRSSSTRTRQGDARRAKRTTPCGETLLLVGIALVLTLFVKTFFVQAFYIPSGSMENTLHVGDRVLVAKVCLPVRRHPQRGDVIVFDGPNSFGEEDGSTPGNPLTKALASVGAFSGGVRHDFVKRVIGLGGDQRLLPRRPGSSTASPSTSRPMSRSVTRLAPASGPSSYRRAGSGSWATTAPTRPTPACTPGRPGRRYRARRTDVIGKVVAIYWPLGPVGAPSGGRRLGRTPIHRRWGWPGATMPLGATSC